MVAYFGKIKMPNILTTKEVLAIKFHDVTKDIKDDFINYRDTCANGVEVIKHKEHLKWLENQIQDMREVLEYLDKIDGVLNRE